MKAISDIPNSVPLTFLNISFLVSLHYMFTNDFVSCLFLIISLSYYSHYKDMALKKHSQSTALVQTGGVSVFRTRSGMRGQKDCFCHSKWTQEAWHSVRKGGERRRKSFIMRQQPSSGGSRTREGEDVHEWRLSEGKNLPLPGRRMNSFIPPVCAVMLLSHFSIFALFFQ